jgi:hypothetical protein
MPNLLAYATGGAAWGAKFDHSGINCGAATPVGATYFFDANLTTFSNTQMGFTSAGLEWVMPLKA